MSAILGRARRILCSPHAAISVCPSGGVDAMHAKLSIVAQCSVEARTWRVWVYRALQVWHIQFNVCRGMAVEWRWNGGGVLGARLLLLLL